MSTTINTPLSQSMSDRRALSVSAKKSLVACLQDATSANAVAREAFQQRALQYHVFLEGSVTGVGMRGQVADAAHEQGLVGWVRNRKDRRVEVVVEGPPEDLEAFLEWCHVGASPPAQVTNVVCERGAASGDFQDFDIRNTL